MDLAPAATGRQDLPAAAACYREAILMEPLLPEAHFNLALVSKRAGRTAEALAGFRRVLRLQPGNSQALCHVADLLCAAGDCASAVVHYRAALAFDPELSEARNNLGNALRILDELPAAIDCFRTLVRLRPDLAEGHYNLGSSLLAVGEPEAAAAALQEALRLKPGYAEAWNNLGLACKALARYPEAIECFCLALRLKPGSAEARWNRAYARLLTGDFARGWQDFEARYDLNQWRLFYPFRRSSPRWGGETLSSGTILVHDEQGLGDTLQFVRYLPWVRQRCARVILETQAPLVDVLRGLPGVDEVRARPDAAPADSGIDAHIALMSLPRITGTAAESIPCVVPYIWPEIDKQRRWAARTAGPGLKVGIVWAGRPAHHNDKNRSCRLQELAGLSRIPGLRLFSLQKGPAAAQLRELGLNGVIDDLDAELGDFTDTAAAVATLDLLVSVDTAVAHLAGAMARPVWVLLPFIPDWRWLLGRTESPWYPTMRLFRQDRAGEWGSVLRRVERALRIHLAGANARGRAESAGLRRNGGGADPHPWASCR
ncbi:MAG: tetratricopeptide repeat-containing glycosyltransferase family protein [Desulfobacterales bacterium]|jgi:tetratricopeptide (TPR) repeat protein|nr:tetratricopeptide repeat-containing glycosyltransferase family protein [Desulfobacterales bacterium]